MRYTDLPIEVRKIILEFVKSAGWENSTTEKIEEAFWADAPIKSTMINMAQRIASLEGANNMLSTMCQNLKKREKENTNSIPTEVKEIEKPYMGFDGADGYIDDFSTIDEAKKELLEYATDGCNRSVHPDFCEGGSFIAKKIFVSGFDVEDCVENYDSPEEWEEETGYNADEVDKIGKPVWLPVKGKEE